MHNYLDGDITQQEEKKLKYHLQECKECQEYFQELNKADAFMKADSDIVASPDFTSKVMAKLPKERKSLQFNRWLKRHPFVVAASLFLLLMTGSFISDWNRDEQFSFSKQPNIIVVDHTVIVPEGEVVQGDIIVKNGNVKIEGKVNGNVIVINGEQYLAHAGQVTGEMEEVNQAFEWLWYKLKYGMKSVFSIE